jgi:4-amino-4-deoxy-L-arabinose transferase-like glycosyltransferase
VARERRRLVLVYRAAMLEARPDRASATSSMARWGLLAFFGGAGLALLGMVIKPPALDPRPVDRLVDTLLVLLGVLLASAGLVGFVCAIARRRAAREGEPRAATPAIVSVSARRLLPSLSLGLGGVWALRFVISWAITGIVPAPRVTLAIVVTVLCLVLLGAALRFTQQLGLWSSAEGSPPPRSRAAWREVGQRGWPLALMLVAYLPALGGFGMIDPWEPEYSEVAREMLSRKDWISLWWGDQGWFWSKPILDFWLQGASYSWFGLNPSPDAMLAGIAAGRSPAPEWAARLPIVGMAALGVLVLQTGVARYFGRRAANLAALILVSCPYWFFIARQTMVDMSYVAPLTAALGFLLLARAAPEGEQARLYRIELGRPSRSLSLSLSGYHVLFTAVAALALVQIFYLVSRHVTIEPGTGLGLDGLGFAGLRSNGLSLHADTVWSGSTGNCMLPGNAPCAVDAEATHTRLQPGLSALLWALCLGLLLWRERHERRLRGLYFVAAWLCVALAVMGKAAPGLALPIAALGGWLVLEGRLAELGDSKLGALALILACVAAPWFVQEYARHGAPFFERLVVYDMLKRAFGHVHDTNAGDDTSFRYYVWQLGYGLFPWSGVAAAGTLFCMTRSMKESATEGTAGCEARFRSGTRLFVAWQLATFGLFSIARTKFHYYILPLVPGAAVLGGVWLDRLWQSGKPVPGLTAGPPRLSLLGLFAAMVTLLIARDLWAQGEMPGAAHLLHLFTYLYTRPWPAGLDHRASLELFGALAVLLCLGLELRRVRRWAVLGFGALGALFSVWALDVYLVGVAPHWSQRDTIGEYYRVRSGPEELLVAYHQNWMGENFYTNNHLATFKVSGRPFTSWIAEQRRTGRRVLFFTTEHASVSALASELGEVASFELLTSPRQNNKFVLARVQL